MSLDKEQLLFEMYKDTTKTGDENLRSELQKKYPDVNISNLHIRIINYQVKKYGRSLNSRAMIKQNYITKRKNIKNRKKEKYGR